MLSPAVAKGISTVLTVPYGGAGAVPTWWVNACGNLAPMASMVLIFAPFPTISQISRDKTVRSLPLLPYSSMVASCFLWTFYGLLKGESKVWGTNLIGLICGLIYSFRFSKYAPAKSPTLPGSIRQHALACLAVVAVSLSLKYVFPVPDPASVIGNLAVVFCVAMFGSPLASIKTVLQTKSAKSIPLPFTLATVLNCFLWSVTGLFGMKDANISVPNLLGLSFGLAQVFLKFLFSDGIAPSEKEQPLI